MVCCLTKVRLWPLPRFRHRSCTFLCFLLLAFNLQAAETKIVGLQFTLGQPQDNPAARVIISEITQGSQKRGFLRIALLPVMVAKGVEIRFQRPALAALAELQEVLRSFAKLEAQELQEVRLFAGADPVPRLLAAEVTPKADHWEMKKVRVRVGGTFREIRECTLYFDGPQAGRCSQGNAQEELRLDLELPQP